MALNKKHDKLLDPKAGPEHDHHIGQNDEEQVSDSSSQGESINERMNYGIQSEGTTSEQNIS